MVRIQTTGGALTPNQLRAIAEIAARFGSDAIQITTRQESRIHDFVLDDVLGVMCQLLQVGLASRGGGRSIESTWWGCRWDAPALPSISMCAKNRHLNSTPSREML